MDEDTRTISELTREFFAIFPDYAFCRTLAANVLEGVTTRRQAIGHLSSKAWAQQRNRQEIQEKLDARTLLVGERRVRIKDLSLRSILDLPDPLLDEVIRFYLKHPYAHGRTLRSRWLPGWIRGFFLRVLIGNARARNLRLDFGECFELLTLL
jgi:hypothetical protein